MYQFILLGAVPFRRDVPRLQRLGVHGVITLNEPFETLVPSSMYQASWLQVFYLFYLKVVCHFTGPIVLECFINLCVCHLGMNCSYQVNQSKVCCDVNAALLNLQSHGIDHLVIPTRDYMFAPSLKDINQAIDFIHSK